MSYGSPSGMALGRPSPTTGRPLTPRTGGSSTPLANNSVSGSPGRNADEITDEEMARVLRRHLVPRSERIGQGRSGNQTPIGDLELGNVLEDTGATSRRASMHSSGEASSRTQSYQPQRADSETFPIPYDAPGGDIT